MPQWVSLFALCLLLLPAACGGGGGGGGGGSTSNANGTNRARFVFDLSLQGAPATLTMDVEIVGNSGVTWGPGVNPDITGVIGTGSYTVFTAGNLVSAFASYGFTGENAFADFFRTSGGSERFRVQWVETSQGLIMIVNPFGQGPVQYDCILRSATPL